MTIHEGGETSKKPIDFEQFLFKKVKTADDFLKHSEAIKKELDGQIEKIRLQIRELANEPIEELIDADSIALLQSILSQLQKISDEIDSDIIKKEDEAMALREKWWNVCDQWSAFMEQHKF